MNTIMEAQKLWSVLEHSKLMKAEFVTIPRVLIQKTPISSMIGLSYDAIVTIGYFEDLNQPPFYSLWDTYSLPWISFEGKSVNQFVQDHRAKFGELTEFYPFEVISNKYFIGKERCIGTVFREPNPEEPNDENCPKFQLFPSDPILGKANSMLFGYENSSFVVRNVDISNNEKFLEVANAKAGVGAMIWKPVIGDMDEKVATRYTMTLTGTLLNIAKSDKVYCSIKDKIVGKPGYNFIVRFDVVKPKKRCTLSYYMMMLKVAH